MKPWIIAVAAIVAGAATAHAQQPVIGGIVFQQDQYFRGIELGMQQAAKGNADLLQGNSSSKPEQEATLIDTYVSRGAKAIVIAPISGKASVRALQRANDKGVKIVLYGSKLDATFPVAFIGTSDSDIGMGTGKIAAAFIKGKLGGKAKVALLGFRSQLAEQSDGRTNGFLEAAKQGIELIEPRRPRRRIEIRMMIGCDEPWENGQAARIKNEIMVAAAEFHAAKLDDAKPASFRAIRSLRLFQRDHPMGDAVKLQIRWPGRPVVQ